MSLTLYLKRQEWFDHLIKMEHRFPGYLPVIKGNGYGFGNEFLADAARQIGKRNIAVGTVEEARQLEESHSFEEMMILTPVLSELEYSDMGDNRVYTVGSMEHLEHLVGQVRSLCQKYDNVWSGSGEPYRLRVVIKCQSSMKRYGFSPNGLKAVFDYIDQCNSGDIIRIQIHGYSIHFPKERTTRNDKEKQIKDWVRIIGEMGRSCHRMYVSHLSSGQYLELREQLPDVEFIMRLGTDLWLHDKSFFEIRSKVLDVKPIRRGERFGYKQGRAWRNGVLVYVSGGTANGVGLEAPVHVRGIPGRLKRTVFWLLELFNLHLSPYTYRGKRLWFAEPPHMQTSVLFVGSREAAPKVGDELPLQIRMTTATFDQYVEYGTPVQQPAEEEPAERKQAEKGKTINALP